MHETKPKNPGPVNFRDSDLHLLLGTLSAFSPQRPRICQMVCSFSVITACLSKQSEVLFLLWLMKIWLFLIVNRYWKSRKESWLRIDRTDMALSYTHTEWISSGAWGKVWAPNAFVHALCAVVLAIHTDVKYYRNTQMWFTSNGPYILGKIVKLPKNRDQEKMAKITVSTVYRWNVIACQVLKCQVTFENVQVCGWRKESESGREKGNFHRCRLVKRTKIESQTKSKQRFHFKNHRVKSKKCILRSR